MLGAFEGLIKPGTHPGYFIRLDVDPATIDINIHPTKTEVKFDDEHTLYAYLKSTIKHSLVNKLFACKESTLSPFNKRTYTMITENDIDRKFI